MKTTDLLHYLTGAAVYAFIQYMEVQASKKQAKATLNSALENNPMFQLQRSQSLMMGIRGQMDATTGIARLIGQS